MQLDGQFLTVIATILIGIVSACITLILAVRKGAVTAQRDALEARLAFEKEREQRIALKNQVDRCMNECQDASNNFLSYLETSSERVYVKIDTYETRYSERVDALKDEFADLADDVKGYQTSTMSSFITREDFKDRFSALENRVTQLHDRLESELRDLIRLRIEGELKYLGKD